RRRHPVCLRSFADCILAIFFFERSGAHRDLHSSPTRRSSDLSGAGMNGCSAVHIGIFGFEPIIKYGSEDLKQRFLPRLVSGPARDRKSTRLNSSHVKISYAVFCLKKKNEPYHHADPRSTPITT